MIKFNNIPPDCYSLFMALINTDQIVGFIYGDDFDHEDDAFSYLCGAIEDLDSYIRETTNGNVILSYPGFSFWVKVSVFPGQSKFIFSRIFNNH